MENYRIFPVVTVFLLLLSSCEKDGPGLTGVVINELMAINNTIIADQDGEYDDWIELFNLKPEAVDLTGFYLSDSKSNRAKWQFPYGTSISGNGYLIIWADKDTTQTGLHTNFKLSSAGENLILSDHDLLTVDKVEYPPQILELSYSRYPNGIGSFIWANPTFNGTNGGSK